MTPPVSVAPFGSEFDDFLFASIGEDKNGLLLSVLSALARKDVDPWREAAELAGLPEEAATRRLASLIAVLPDMPVASLTSGVIARRLIGLLPQRAAAAPAKPETRPGVGLVTSSQAITYMILYVILMAFLLGAHGLTASYQASTQANETNSNVLPATGGAGHTTAPDVPSPGTDQ